MAMVRREFPTLSMPDLALPYRWRRMFDWDMRPGWMAMEEFQEGGELVVRTEIPDVDPEKDIEITADHGLLHIHATREQRSEVKGESGVRSEFRYGEFDREVGLPRGVKPKDLKATYHNGILEVRVPIPESDGSDATKVPISV